MLSKFKGRLGLAVAAAVVAVAGAAVTTGTVVPTTAAPIVAPLAADATIQSPNPPTAHCVSGPHAGYWLTDWREQGSPSGTKTWLAYNVSATVVQGGSFYFNSVLSPQAQSAFTFQRPYYWATQYPNGSGYSVKATYYYGDISC